MQKEYSKITIVTNTDDICPECGRYVDRKGLDAAYIISGKGKFKRKQYYHKSCIMHSFGGSK